MNRQTDEIIEEIVNELNHMINVPLSINLGERAKQAELSISAEHIKHCLTEIVNNEIYLLERLKHSETERFKNDY